MPALLPTVFVALLVGCSQPSGPAHPQPAGSGSEASATEVTGSAAPDRPPGPTAAECASLFAHAVEIRVAEQRQTVPPEQVPTQDEQTELRAKLEAEQGPACRAGSRETYRCGLAAKTLAELEACR